MENTTEHYICKGGCRGVSDKPATCQAADCSLHGVALEACKCANGKHGGAFEPNADAEESGGKE